MFEIDILQYQKNCHRTSGLHLLYIYLCFKRITRSFRELNKQSISVSVQKFSELQNPHKSNFLRETFS